MNRNVAMPRGNNAPRQLTSEAGVGDFIKYNRSDGTVEYGEVVKSSQDLVEILWDNGEKQELLRDLLGHHRLTMVSDKEVPTPEGFCKLLAELYDLEF